jgi:hypothetical protein
VDSSSRWKVVCNTTTGGTTWPPNTGGKLVPLAAGPTPFLRSPSLASGEKLPNAGSVYGQAGTSACGAVQYPNATCLY